MFKCSPEEKIIVEFIKMTCSKVFIRLILNTVNDPQLGVCLVIVVHESLVCPEQFNFPLFFRKILQLTLILLWYSSIFVYLTLSNNDYDFEIHLFTPRKTHVQLLQKIKTIADAPEGEKHALRAGA